LLLLSLFCAIGSSIAILSSSTFLSNQDVLNLLYTGFIAAIVVCPSSVQHIPQNNLTLQSNKSVLHILEVQNDFLLLQLPQDATDFQASPISVRLDHHIFYSHNKIKFHKTFKTKH